ncbi:hypothetical protein VA7868_03498 [Vibrio aerogenes CECT 7868]|uniref:Uncharacterized protein n=1 Tax=Vibrio aerogenes CECT 7868 TaxID=1216006 RepID=A0A1M6A7A6_9VIBR|nr:hypothetical protein [Vibrio aerogenes]SHI32307.1 hypothetical protein VA7868_03498 [Vibrio aerogenes CECT 7868]
MKKIIQTVFLGLSAIWLSLTWLWIANIPVFSYLFADSDGNLGLLFILCLFILNLLITVVSCIYTYNKKYWWGLVAYLVLGGGPIIAAYYARFS